MTVITPRDYVQVISLCLLHFRSTSLSTRVTAFSTNSRNNERVFPGGPGVKNVPADAGVRDSIPGPGRSHMLGGAKPVHHNYRSLRALQPRLQDERPLQ